MTKTDYRQFIDVIEGVIIEATKNLHALKLYLKNPTSFPYEILARNKKDLDFKVVNHFRNFQLLYVINVDLYEEYNAPIN